MLGQLVLGHAGVEPQLARAVEQPVDVVAEPEDVAVPHMRHGVGHVGVPEAGVEDRDPGVLGGMYSPSIQATPPANGLDVSSS